MPLVAVNASPSTSSRTRSLAEAALELAGEGRLIDVASLDADALLFRGSHPSVDEAVDAIAEADRLVLVTPVYRATYSGLLKVLVDHLPTGALASTACVLAATADTRDHFLSLDTGLRALVTSLDGWTVPTVVYATADDFTGDGKPGDTIMVRLEGALGQAAAIAGGIRLD
jgi:FMN reductase